MDLLLRPLSALRDWLAIRWPCADRSLPEPLDWTWDELGGQPRRVPREGHRIPDPGRQVGRGRIL